MIPFLNNSIKINNHIIEKITIYLQNLKLQRSIMHITLRGAIHQVLPTRSLIPRVFSDFIVFVISTVLIFPHSHQSLSVHLHKIQTFGVCTISLL